MIQSKPASALQEMQYEFMPCTFHDEIEELPIGKRGAHADKNKRDQMNRTDLSEYDLKQVERPGSAE